MKVPDSHWMTALAAADRGAVKGTAVFTRAVMKARNVALTLPVQDKLMRAALLGSVDEILDCLPWDTYWREQVEGFEPILLETAVAGAKAAIPNILQAREAVWRHDRNLTKRRRRIAKKEEPSTQTTTTIKPPGSLNRLRGVFDKTNPDAVAWAKLHAGEMITLAADKEAIRGLVAKAQAEGIPHRVIAKQIVPYIGLGSQQAATLQNWMNAWTKKHPGKPIDPQKAQNKCDALVRKRAKFIALNEALMAAKHGNQAQLDAAFVAGDLQDGRYLKEWVLTPDDKLCPICSAQRTPDGELLTVPVGDPWPLKAKGITIGMIPHAHPRCRCVQALVENPNWIATPGPEISGLIGGLPKWIPPSFGSLEPFDPDAEFAPIDWSAYTSVANDLDLLNIAKTINDRVKGCVEKFVVKDEPGGMAGMSHAAASYDPQTKTLTMHRVPGVDWIAQIEILGVKGYGVKSRIDDVITAVLKSKRQMETLTGAGKEYALFRAQEQVMRRARKDVLAKMGIADAEFVGSTAIIESLMDAVADPGAARKALWGAKDKAEFKTASSQVASEAMLKILEMAKATGALSPKTCEQYKWAVANAPEGALGWSFVWSTPYAGQQALAQTVLALTHATKTGKPIDPKSPAGKAIAKAMKEASGFVASKVVLPPEVLAQLKAEAKAQPKKPKAPAAPKAAPVVPGLKLGPGESVVSGHPTMSGASSAAGAAIQATGVVHYVIEHPVTGNYMVVATKPTGAAKPIAAPAPAPAKPKTPAKPKAAPKPKPAPEPVAQPATVPVKPVVEPTTKPTADPHDFVAVDSAWVAQKITADKAFTFDREARSELGGMHTKFIYKDADGNSWLFKPTAEPFRAIGDEVAYKMARVVDPDNVVEVRAIELTVNGRKTLGSIQKMVSDLEIGDFHPIKPSALSAGQLRQINREHVVDWLIGNHDGHAGNLLQTKAGKIVGIDKGQAYKFILQPNEALSRTFKPNPEESYYQTIAAAVKKKAVDVDDFDLSDAFEAIKRAQALTDSQLREIVKPYVEGRTQSALEREKLYTAMVARKNNLASDFERYWSELLGRPVKVPGTGTTDVPAATQKPKVQVAAADAVPGWSAKHDLLLEDAVRAGWQGKTIDFDGGIVEDMSALVWQEKTDAGNRTVIQMKLRPEADSGTGTLAHTMIDQLVAQVSQTRPRAEKKGEALQVDVDGGYFTALQSAVKTVAVHAVDQKFNMQAINHAREKVSELLETVGIDPNTGKLLPKSPTQDHDYLQMAQAYKELMQLVDRRLAAAQTGAPKPEPGPAAKALIVEGYFRPYVRQADQVLPKAPATSDLGIKSARKTNEDTHRKLDKDGNLVVKSDAATANVISGGTLSNESLWHIDLGDGVLAKWWGNSADTAYYARRGLLQLEVAGNVSPATVQKALSKLKNLGFSEQTVRMSTPADLEVLYLTKSATAAGQTTTKGWTDAVASVAGKPAAEQVRALRAFWEKKLKVADLTQLPNYQPEGYYEAGAVTRQITAGYRQHARFDVDLTSELKDLRLASQITHGTVDGFFETILEGKTASMLSTTERYRLGIAGTTMSQDADMRSGGASYVFTRLRSKTAASGSHVVFKPELLNRMDRRTFQSDVYGAVNPDDHRSKTRKTALIDVKACARGANNETNFLNSVNVLDYLDVVHAGSVSARQRILALFRAHGYNKLPDGRLIEQVIKT